MHYCRNINLIDAMDRQARQIKRKDKETLSEKVCGK